MRCLDFTASSLLIMSGIQRNNLIVIKSLTADNSSAANKEVILEIQIDSLKEHRARMNLHVAIFTKKTNAQVCVTIKERKEH